ncbi:MAG: hypothetical protein ACOH5I_14035 [Oligoflexus sp.]
MATQPSEAAQLAQFEQATENLKKLVRNRVQQTLSKSARLGETKISEVKNVDDFAYDHWMAFIMISGSSIRIMLKIHFNTTTAIDMLTHRPRNKDTDRVQRMAMDFMKEQCNLMAGALKGSLNNAKIVTGLSIPLVTRGFDEAVFSDKVDRSKINDVWRLDWDEGAVTCSSVLEILDWNDLVNFQVESEDEDEDDGVFL